MRLVFKRHPICTNFSLNLAFFKFIMIVFDFYEEKYIRKCWTKIPKRWWNSWKFLLSFSSATTFAQWLLRHTARANFFLCLYFLNLLRCRYSVDQSWSVWDIIFMNICSKNTSIYKKIKIYHYNNPCLFWSIYILRSFLLKEVVFYKFYYNND